ncbi:hypothetical protein PAPYR_6290 [Paratrimastix pyriformis]|uniref:Uncharacterized protein n=1 Tax=Paratrimastix pyriformis TaxID=342808 RepID=A0ABQ8UKM9_9EUKA|nr:hypothetical protein PAPYR_6290 [Paratrimastix pyriformis]
MIHVILANKLPRHFGFSFRIVAFVLLVATACVSAHPAKSFDFSSLSSVPDASIDDDSSRSVPVGATTGSSDIRYCNADVDCRTSGDINASCTAALITVEGVVTRVWSCLCSSGFAGGGAGKSPCTRGEDTTRIFVLPAWVIYAVAGGGGGLVAIVAAVIIVVVIMKRRRGKRVAMITQAAPTPALQPRSSQSDAVSTPPTASASPPPVKQPAFTPPPPASPLLGPHPPAGLADPTLVMVATTGGVEQTSKDQEADRDAALTPAPPAVPSGAPTGSSDGMVIATTTQGQYCPPSHWPPPWPAVVVGTGRCGCCWIPSHPHPTGARTIIHLHTLTCHHPPPPHRPALPLQNPHAWPRRPPASTLGPSSTPNPLFLPDPNSPHLPRPTRHAVCVRRATPRRPSQPCGHWSRRVFLTPASAPATHWQRRAAVRHTTDAPGPDISLGTGRFHRGTIHLHHRGTIRIPKWGTIHHRGTIHLHHRGTIHLHHWGPIHLHHRGTIRIPEWGTIHHRGTIRIPKWGPVYRTHGDRLHDRGIRPRSGGYPPGLAALQPAVPAARPVQC